MNKKPKDEYAIQTVGNALRLLREFSDDAELGVTELSRRLGLHKNNIFRLLATLELQDFVEQSPDTERYRLGPRSLELGLAFARGHDLMRRARPILAQLALATGECAHLGAMQDFEVSHLDGEAGAQLLGASCRVGRRLPLHSSALGKVLLGGAAREVWEAYDRTVVATGPLRAATEQTICDPHKLFEHVRAVSFQGFALDLEECAPGLCCLAAPVHDGRGQVVAALSISAPGVRWSEERLLSELKPVVLGACERLSRDLGFQAPIAAGG